MADNMKKALITGVTGQDGSYLADELGFRVLLCVGGCGNISFRTESFRFYKGDCIFVPADSEELKIHGQAQFLDVRG